VTVPGELPAVGLGGAPRVGVDLVDVGEIARSLERFGDAYEARVFTALERTQCAGSPPARAASLAARFAAKEAVMKVLEPDGPRPDWRGIEVDRLAGGACRLRLSGSAAELAARRGLGSWAVSLTHEGDLAAAVVMAVAAEVGLRRDAPAPVTGGARQGSGRDAAVGEPSARTPVADG